MLSRVLIEEFRVVVREDYQRNLSYEEACLIAQDIIGYYDTLARINYRLNLKKKKYERH